MSDEEKKAIESLIEIREFANLSSYKDVRINQLNAIDIILNLIEKQSKAIEEYKKQLDLDYVDKHFVPIERYNQLEKEIEELNKSDASKEQSSMDYYNLYKELVDKIKAKIEEVEQWELYNMKIPRLSTLDERLGAKIGIKYVLQSLLEKE